MRCSSRNPSSYQKLLIAQVDLPPRQLLQIRVLYQERPHKLRPHLHHPLQKPILYREHPRKVWRHLRRPLLVTSKFLLALALGLRLIYDLLRPQQEQDFRPPLPRPLSIR